MMSKRFYWNLEAPMMMTRIYKLSGAIIKNNLTLQSALAAEPQDKDRKLLKLAYRHPEILYKDWYSNNMMSPMVEDTVVSPEIIRTVFKFYLNNKYKVYELLYPGTIAPLEEVKASTVGNVVETFLEGLGRDQLVNCQDVFGKYFPGVQIPGKMLKSIADWITTKNADGTTILQQIMESIDLSQDALWCAAGHSLGGALVQVHVLLAALKGKKINLKLYGAFAVYDTEAAAFFNKLITDCENYQFTDDPVPDDTPVTKHVGKVLYAKCGTTILPGSSHSMKHYENGIMYAEMINAHSTANKFNEIWNSKLGEAGKTVAVSEKERKDLVDKFVN